VCVCVCARARACVYNIYIVASNLNYIHTISKIFLMRRNHYIVDYHNGKHEILYPTITLHITFILCISYNFIKKLTFCSNHCRRKSILCIRLINDNEIFMETMEILG